LALSAIDVIDVNSASQSAIISFNKKEEDGVTVHVPKTPAEQVQPKIEHKFCSTAEYNYNVNFVEWLLQGI
jgi:hypothetical protein